MDLRLSNWGLERISDWIIVRKGINPEDDMGISGSTILSIEIPGKVFQNIDATSQAKHNASESLSQDIHVSKAPETNSVRSEKCNPLLIMPHHNTVSGFTDTRTLAHIPGILDFCSERGVLRVWTGVTTSVIEEGETQIMHVRGSNIWPLTCWEEAGILWDKENTPGYSRVID